MRRLAGVRKPNGDREPAAEILILSRAKEKDLWKETMPDSLQLMDDHARTLNARQSRRCAHLKTNGDRCGSPALSGKELCYFHEKALADERPVRLPVLEDANAIQVSVMIVMDGLYRGNLSYQKAALLLYGLQIASYNLKQLQLAPKPDLDK